MSAYLDMWKNYFNFKGRTTVRGYWMAFLFNCIIGFILGILAGFVPALGIVGGIYSLAAMIPGIALTVRRLHDSGRAGVYILISLIPLVGGILLLVWLCKPSVPENQYGACLV